MATVHTVAQGETLIRIAKQYDYIDPNLIYQHESNKAFRELRPDPNIIYPGDKINIPDKEKRVRMGSTGRKHTFRIKKAPLEVFRIKLQNGSGNALIGTKVLMDVQGQTIETEVGEDGLIELELPDNAETGNLKLFMDPESDDPTHEYDMQIGHLDPVEELSGVQARCNLLGFECGVADGVMGRNTRAGVSEFQEAYGLDIDGVPGPITKAKLKEVYGF